MNRYLKRWFNVKQAALRKWYHHYSAVRNIVSAQEDIDIWFAATLGQRLLSQEKTCLDKLLPEMFGYHFMQLSVLSNCCLFASSLTSHQFSLSPMLENTQKNKKLAFAAVSEFEHLPIDSDSIDIALLHHVLDFSVNPHQLLREVTRSVIPNGRIIIIGFNPFSMLGVINRIACLFSHSNFYRRNHLRVNRLKDWFKVLELDLIYNKRGYYGFPVGRYYSPIMETVGENMFPLCGSFYLLVVRKRITSLTPIKTQWNKKKILPKWREGITMVSKSHLQHRQPEYFHPSSLILGVE